ncbi:MAG: sulfur carrier protein ThiS adenylyltransferase ThiF [Bacteroidales bacterium]|nr:sulfur carrier protein ThiS adenylyltransferase ThiF [Bacteroidales bacterium]
MQRNVEEILRIHTVGIAGCGGLGSNCAVALARIGIGHLVLADFDVVEPGNLNRQYYFLDQIGQKKVQALKSNILRINPCLRIDTYPVMLDPDTIRDIFKKCDVIVEAFDRKEMKHMIAETVLMHMPHIPLVMGSGLAGWGHSELLAVRRSGDLYVCGDEASETSDQLPPLAPRVGIVANMQANVVLEILMGREE